MRRAEKAASRRSHVCGHWHNSLFLYHYIYFTTLGSLGNVLKLETIWPECPFWSPWRLRIYVSLHAESILSNFHSISRHKKATEARTGSPSGQQWKKSLSLLTVNTQWNDRTLFHSGRTRAKNLPAAARGKATFAMAAAMIDTSFRRRRVLVIIWVTFYPKLRWQACDVDSDGGWWLLQLGLISELNVWFQQQC